VWGVEDAFPVVHGRVVDVVSEHEVISVGLDVACVDGGAFVCVLAQELELGGADSSDVEVRPESLDVGLIVNVHLGHVYEQRSTVAGVAHGLDHGVRDVLGEGPARTTAAAVVTGVVEDFVGEKTEVEVNLGDARRVKVLARLDFVIEPGKFFLDLSQKVICRVVQLWQRER